MHNYATRSLGAVMSLFSLNWNWNWSSSNSLFSAFGNSGLPWLARVSAPVPIAPNFFAFSFTFVLGVLAYELCVDLF